jgi:hypothetical protein
VYDERYAWCEELWEVRRMKIIYIDINATDNERRAVLDKAAEKGWGEMVHILVISLANKADPSLVDEEGRTQVDRTRDISPRVSWPRMTSDDKPLLSTLLNPTQLLEEWTKGTTFVTRQSRHSLSLPTRTSPVFTINVSDSHHQQFRILERKFHPE